MNCNKLQVVDIFVLSRPEIVFLCRPIEVEAKEIASGQSSLRLGKYNLQTSYSENCWSMVSDEKISNISALIQKAQNKELWLDFASE